MNNRCPVVITDTSDFLKLRFFMLIFFGGNYYHIIYNHSFYIWNNGIRFARIQMYRVPGFTGRVGFISSMTSDYCDGCNRLRLMADGNLKACLFQNNEIDLRWFLTYLLNNLYASYVLFSEHKKYEFKI